jgi:hypothetical protein
MPACQRNEDPVETDRKILRKKRKSRQQAATSQENQDAARKVVARFGGSRSAAWYVVTHNAVNVTSGKASCVAWLTEGGPSAHEVARRTLELLMQQGVPVLRSLPTPARERDAHA